MRVLSVLLYFTLAYGVTASIFKPHRHSVELNIQQRDDSNPHNRHRNHHSDHNKHSEQQTSYEYHASSDSQDYSPSEQFNHQYTQQYSQSNEQYPNQQWNQPQSLKNLRDQQLLQRYQPYQNPTRQSQYQPSSTQQSQEQGKSYPYDKHSGSSHDKQKLHQYSSSSESHSHESKEKRNFFKDAQSAFFDDSQKWASSQQSSAQDSEMASNEDTVPWKHFKMTVGSNISVQEKENLQKIFRDAQNAMKHPTEEEKMKYHQALDQQQRNEDENNAILNATQLAQKHQYPVEEHIVRTDDGYQITVFRIPPKNYPRSVQKSPVVFLMHGLNGNADEWLLKGPQVSLPYMLSDEGYDVWLGNARGNKYAQQHVSKSPAISDFWQYSTDEIALHDLPAMIDYALNTTNQQELYYIGHSQGNTAFFALTAAHPEYNKKIKHMYALSPMVYMTNVRSPLIRMIAPTSQFHNILQRQLGNGPFYPRKDQIRTFGGALLQKETGSKAVASNINTVMAGFHAEDEDLSTLPVVMQHSPVGTSTKVVRHYSQGVASQDFQRYDYGPTVNLKVYGSEQPPKYDVQKVAAPVSLYYSEEDWLAHPKDVERLKNELPNVKESYKVPVPHFSNMDFQFSTKAPEIYRRLIESMKNNQ